MIKPRKVQKYPELWWLLESTVILTYPNGKVEIDYHFSEGWYCAETMDSEFTRDLLYHNTTADITFLGEIK